MSADPEYRPIWKNRRRVIFGSLIMDCVFIFMVLVGWFLGFEVNASVAAIASALIVKDLAIIASYVFGATWEDINLWKP